jgi:hypothetical protein
LAGAVIGQLAEGCPTLDDQKFPATGQTKSYLPSDDGAIKAGAVLRYSDNRDGTITDENTKLMWEKKDRGTVLHAVNFRYTWIGTCSISRAACGTDADCGASGGTCTASEGAESTIFQWVARLNAEKFAGHSDWRIPNVKELQSVVDYGRDGPAVNISAFNKDCFPNCTVDGADNTVECSCTRSENYWSGTTFSGLPDDFAWAVNFNLGRVDAKKKTDAVYVRAVRCGLVK